TPVTAADIALHRLCHARGLQWARHAPGVQFLRDLLDRLKLDRASSGRVSCAQISLNRSQTDNRRSQRLFLATRLVPFRAIEGCQGGSEDQPGVGCIRYPESPPRLVLPD